MLLGIAGYSYSQQTDSPGKNWEAAFLSPPESTKPWVYWYWDNDNISKEGITKDLEAMAQVGIGEALIGNIVGGASSKGKVTVLSEDWWSCMVHAITEAKRLGMKIGVFNCPGWSQSGGPWVKPEQTMRYLVSTELQVTGGQSFAYAFKPPTENFQLVSVQAFPVPAEDNDGVSTKSPVVSSKGMNNAQWLFDGDPNTEVVVPATEQQLEIKLNSVATVRSLQITPGNDPVTADCDLEAINDKGAWQRITHLHIDRSNMDIAVGPMRYGPVVISFPAVKAQTFRLRFTNGKGGKLREIELSGAPRLTAYVEKQLGKMWPYAEVRPDSYTWPATAEPEHKSLVVDPARVIDLSTKVDKSGNLNWAVPAGEWIILYTGMTPTGVTNSPTTTEGSGLEIDKMNKQLAQFHFDAFIGELLKRTPAEDRVALRHVVADSYEKGSENWTDGLGEDFKRTYGYDPYPFLPVLTGRIVASADRSDRFLWDLRRLVADRIASNYVGGLRERCQQNGLRLWLENYGHWGFPGEFLSYGGASDDLGGEFWYGVPSLGPVEVRCASSAGHTYGKKVVSAEAFTSGLSFTQMPRNLKTRGDWAWSEGINHFVMHVYIHQPDDRKPGMSAWFGTDFNRNNTWFTQSKTYFDYIRRSCALLQQGHTVADVAYFIGEDAPKMTGDKDPALPPGYNYDFINAEMLAKARVVNDRIVLASGASYAVLVLPPKETMRPEILKKIVALVADGACVLGNAPAHSPSGRDYPFCDTRVQALAKELWGFKMVGKGHVFTGIGLKKVLRQIGVAEDCVLGKDFLYTHRQEGNAHCYFVSNQLDIARKDTMAFRVTGLQPELWDAVTGQIKALPNYAISNGKTVIPLEFGPGDSWFIIFRNKATVADGKENFEQFQPVQAVEGNWTVDFNPGYAKPFQATFARLTDWSQHDDPQIKYYSGTATYSSTFTCDDKKDSSLYLDLGQVEGLATVRLNGKEYPTLWRYPYRVNISNQLQPGENELEVTVVNCWWNRLVGDAQPGAKPVTWTAFTNWHADSKLQPAGLLGPVNILTAK
ncbi:glycoside hydrolase family 2 sugar binding protein [Niastella koreensis GR20-10]|uniref:Glycoside hydrolase family 2 sugar binding protein n=2 Tax=Niastella koreensis TaxID=354356 RepID=G8TD41_NIAKG|nr:glycoside hydrolase family 2 sugar binding protein [Niastella koreensis GR20-10]